MSLLPRWDIKVPRPRVDMLADPDNSTLLVVDVVESALKSLAKERRVSFEKSLVFVSRASTLLGVPICLSLVEGESAKALVGWQVDQADFAVVSYRSSVKSPWTDVSLVDQLKTSGRTKLFLAGFWMETSLSFAALDALKEGFDVSLIADTVAAQAPQYSEFIMARLSQAGVVPTTSRQIVSEWQATLRDHSRSSALEKFLIASDS